MGRWFLNFSFEGRARRAHTWANWLCWVGVSLIFWIVEIGLAAAHLTVLVVALFALLTGIELLDSMAMTFRRAHDVGKSGWIWILLLIPIVNLLPLYWLLIEDSQQGPNKYGIPVKQFYQPEDPTPQPLPIPMRPTPTHIPATFNRPTAPLLLQLDGISPTGEELRLELRSQELGRDGATIGADAGPAHWGIDPRTERRVSRTHARVYFDAEDFWVEDTGSTNGTKLNGTPLTPGVPARLETGDVVEFSDVALRATVRLAEAAA